MRSRTIIYFGILAVYLLLLHQVLCQNASKSRTESKSAGRSYFSYVNEIVTSIPRQLRTSQVLTLNMTNALLLVLLKVLMVGAAYFGHGFNFLGRNANTIFNEYDVPFAVAFMSSANRDDYQCLYKMACEEPEVAQDYLMGARMMNNLFKAFKWVIPYNPKYEVILRSLDDALITGQKPDKSCQAKYTGCDQSSRRH